MPQRKLLTARRLRREKADSSDSSFMFLYPCLLPLSVAASNAVVHRLLTNCFSLLPCFRNGRFCTQVVDRQFQTVASQPESP